MHRQTTQSRGRLGGNNYWKADFAADLSDALIDVHVEFAPRIPNIMPAA